LGALCRGNQLLINFIGKGKEDTVLPAGASKTQAHATHSALRFMGLEIFFLGGHAGGGDSLVQVYKLLYQKPRSSALHRLGASGLERVDPSEGGGKKGTRGGAWHASGF